MDFFPKADWQWVYDHEQGKLSVMDRDRCFPLVYKKNMLVFTESQTLPFTVEDVSRYIELFESDDLSHFNEALRAKIILHLLAIDSFHKPIMPKSWLFDTPTSIEQDYTKGELVTLTTTGMKQSAKYMVLEQQQGFCLCMLFDPSHQLTTHKYFEQFQLIKVTSDKLTRCAKSKSQEWISFQNAG